MDCQFSEIVKSRILLPYIKTKNSYDDMLKLLKETDPVILNDVSKHIHKIEAILKQWLVIACEYCIFLKILPYTWLVLGNAIPIVVCVIWLCLLDIQPATLNRFSTRWIITGNVEFSIEVVCTCRWADNIGVNGCACKLLNQTMFDWLVAQKSSAR